MTSRESKARALTRKTARVAIVRCYLNNVFAPKPATIQRLLGWRKDECDAAIDELVEAGEMRKGVQVQKVPGEHVALTSIF